MDVRLSQHIARLRLLLVCGLVYVHYGPLPHSDTNPFRGVARMDNLFPELLNSAVLYLFFAAVPLLSMISGYLLFQSSSQRLATKLRKRGRTILLPSLCWLGLWLGILVLTAQMIPAVAETWDPYWRNLEGVLTALTGFRWPTQPFATDPYGLYEWFNATVQSPVALQFWFIHDLILVLILAPLLRLVLLWMPKLTLLGIALIWLSGFNPPLMFNANVMTFFAFGAALAIYRWSMEIPGPLWLWSLGLLMTILIRVLTPVGQTPVGGMPVEHEIECLIRLLGVMVFHKAVWRVSVQGPWLQLAPAAFFVFASHYPTVLMLKAVTGHWMDGPWWQVVNWLIVPPLTILLCLAMAVSLWRFHPATFLLLNGQRGLGEVVTRIQGNRLKAKEERV